MRPFVLKGHTRPITWVMYNREGDLLFTCAKDKHICVFFDSDGSLMGTYEGHDGSVNSAVVSWNSDRLLTASSDFSVRLWEVETGKELCKWSINAPCRACSFSFGERMAAFSSDKFKAAEPSFHILYIHKNIEDQTDELKLSVNVTSRINRLKWSELNSVLITAHEDGNVRKWDVETGNLIESKMIHEGSIMDMRFSTDMTHFVTASADKTAKLMDARTFEILKVYKAGSPLNAIDMSPTHDYIVVGGGQEAEDVAVKGSGGGVFESRFFHKIYCEEFGRVKGHFSPINTIVFHPSGRGFVSGSEEGFVRSHKFDDDYFTTKYI